MCQSWLNISLCIEVFKALVGSVFKKKKLLTLSVVVKQILKNRNHSINWKNSEIMAHERSFKLRKREGGLFIKQAANPTMNTDKRLQLNNSWQPNQSFQNYQKSKFQIILSLALMNNLVVES